MLDPQSDDILIDSSIEPLQPNRGSLFGVILLFEIGLGLFAFLMAWFQGIFLWDLCVWDMPAFEEAVFATLPTGLGLIGFWYLPWKFCTRFRRLVLHKIVPLFAPMPLWKLIVISVAAGWGEELLFRGWLQPIATNWLGIVAGIAIVSLLFALAHALSWLYFVLAFAMSCYLSWVFNATGNLAVPIMVHAFYDAWALIFLVRIAPSRDY